MTLTPEGLLTLFAIYVFATVACVVMAAESYRRNRLRKIKEESPEWYKLKCGCDFYVFHRPVTHVEIVSRPHCPSHEPWSGGPYVRR